MPRIDGERVKEILANGIVNFVTYARDAYENRLDDVASEAAADAIELGIKNTVASLYEANVEDKEIIRIMNTVWGIARDEATELLLNEKAEAPQVELREYLRLQGMSQDDIRKFMRENRVRAKLRNYPELRAIRRKPEKLLKAIQEHE